MTVPDARSGTVSSLTMLQGVLWDFPTLSVIAHRLLDFSFSRIEENDVDVADGCAVRCNPRILPQGRGDAHTYVHPTAHFRRGLDPSVGQLHVLLFRRCVLIVQEIKGQLNFSTHVRMSPAVLADDDAIHDVVV